MISIGRPHDVNNTKPLVIIYKEWNKKKQYFDCRPSKDEMFTRGKEYTSVKALKFSTYLKEYHSTCTIYILYM